MKKIIKLFEDGNVSVCGLRGRGKDMLMSNVVVRRSLPYVSNVDYGGEFFSLDLSSLDCGLNSYTQFISGKVNYYVYPFPDKTDVYISDAGVYFPSQYVSELNRLYPHFPSFMALSRHLGEFNVHFNVQNLNRVWDKIREQSDTYIMCCWCKVFFRRFVFQKIYIYERYQSAVDRVPPYRPPSIFSGMSRSDILLQRQNYLLQHGEITPRILFYRNKSSYDTRFFKTILENGSRKRV